MRRLLVEQRSKDGLQLILSDARPDEHWKRVWLGTRAFNGYIHDLYQPVGDANANATEKTQKMNAQHNAGTNVENHEERRQNTN